MSENAVIITESLFNITYLLIIWGVVIAMIKRWDCPADKDRAAAFWFFLAFALLALGDTGHVGFRVLAFTRDGLETTVKFMGKQWYLVMLGSIATAWTFTVFYVCLIFLWSRRYNKPLEAVALFGLVLAVIRSFIMLLPQNNWNSLEITEPWYFIRNMLLILMQVCTAYLILRDSIKLNDKSFRWIGYMILVSLVCYAPVVLWVETYPQIGMLMIPKTLAYMAILFIGFITFYKREKAGVNNQASAVRYQERQKSC